MAKKVVIGSIVLVAIVVLLYYFFVLQKPVSQITPLENEQRLEGDLYGNPGKVVPETNPFQKVETSPLKGTNPFEGGYKNPFGE